MRVLVVCSGNICRSPLVAEYLRHRVSQAGLAHVVVDSAGTLGIENAPAAPEAIEVAREHGVDLRWHRSSGLKHHHLQTADVVFGMERHHLDAIEALDAEVRPRGYLLRAFEAGPDATADPPDLDDPIGRSVDTFAECFDTVRRCVDHFVIHLRHGATDP